MKLCVDCKHHRKYYFDRCQRFYTVSPVTGDKAWPNEYGLMCSNERASILGRLIRGACGKDGLFWEPKE